MVLAAIWLSAVSCSDPGAVVGPAGVARLRTARYALTVRDGLPEMTILLSNGALSCGIPALGDPDLADAIVDERTALCREGAQHVVLSILDPQTAWDGRFPGQRREAGAPRRASGAYYAVEESALLEVEGFDRGYVAIEDVFLPELGAGAVTLDSPGIGGGNDPCERGVGRVRGSFAFDGVGVSGSFTAEPCPCTDASTLEILSLHLPYRCERYDIGTP